jgi:hypothetical protein
VWEAGIGLAAWLRKPEQAPLLRGKSVLELGCGCGLPGTPFTCFTGTTVHILTQKALAGIAVAQGVTSAPCSVTLSDMGDTGNALSGGQPWELLANARYNARYNANAASHRPPRATSASGGGDEGGGQGGGGGVAAEVVRIDWGDAIHKAGYAEAVAAAGRRYHVIIASHLLCEA